jgi:hypothetical protein
VGGRGLRTLGKLKSWRWIKTPTELWHALSYHGAVEAGSIWLDSMWDVNPVTGYLEDGGYEIGGHAYAISGYRTVARGVDYWIDNSWGESWGVYGGAWMPDTLAHKLWFHNGGEIALPIK